MLPETGTTPKSKVTLSSPNVYTNPLSPFFLKRTAVPLDSMAIETSISSSPDAQSVGALRREKKMARSYDDLPTWKCDGE